jgi:hypothetical protein
VNRGVFNYASVRLAYVNSDILDTSGEYTHRLVYDGSSACENTICTTKLIYSSSGTTAASSTAASPTTGCSGTADSSASTATQNTSTTSTAAEIESAKGSIQIVYASVSLT